MDNNNGMRTLVVGDLHGNKEIAQQALSNKEADRVVFLGDYLDSFNRSPEDQVETLLTVLEAAETLPDEVVALMGNHERSYMYPTETCSGWRQETDTMVTHLVKRMEDTLKPYHWEQGWLLSHAGVSQGLLAMLDMSVEEYLESGDYCQIGSFRGGCSSEGGLFWNDWNMEFIPINGVKQIVGHTHYSYNGRTKGRGENFNIDCLPQTEVYVEGETPAVGIMLEDGEASSYVFC